jgi:hypothetical protein
VTCNFFVKITHIFGTERGALHHHGTVIDAAETQASLCLLTQSPFFIRFGREASDEAAAKRHQERTQVSATNTEPIAANQNRLLHAMLLDGSSKVAISGSSQAIAS